MGSPLSRACFAAGLSQAASSASASVARETGAQSSPAGGDWQPPYVRIDVACEKNWKVGREREKGSESTTNGRVSQSGSGKASESGVAVGGGSGAGIGRIEMVSLSMEQALW